MTWPVLDLVDVSAVRRKERSRRQSTPSSCPRLCPTAPPFCLLLKSRPSCRSRTQRRPSPWCQLPASVFPAAPGSGSYSCPRAYGAALQDPAPAPGPRTPFGRGAQASSACPWKELCCLLFEYICLSPACFSLAALGHGVQQGPGERERGAQAWQGPPGTWLCGVVGS